MPCDTAEGLAIVPGDWCHVTPTAALPHLQHRARARNTQHHRRPGCTSGVATDAIAARARLGPRRRQPRTTGGVTGDARTTDRAAGDPTPERTSDDPETGRAADAVEPGHTTDDPETGRAADNLGPGHSTDDGATPRRARTAPGAGQAARAARAQLAAARQHRQLLE